MPGGEALARAPQLQLQVGLASVQPEPTLTLFCVSPSPPSGPRGRRALDPCWSPGRGLVLQPWKWSLSGLQLWPESFQPPPCLGLTLTLLFFRNHMLEEKDKVAPMGQWAQKL